MNRKTIFQYALEQGNSFIEKQNMDIQNYASVQKQTLQNILLENSMSEYGKLYDFSSIKDTLDYATQVPISTYRVYRPYIQRMIDTGEQNVLFSETLSCWATTSATSGNIKYIPQTQKMSSFYIQNYVLRGLALANKEYKRKTGLDLENGYVLMLMGNPLRQVGTKNIPVTSIGSTCIISTESNLQKVCIPPLDTLTKDRSFTTDIRYLYLRYGLVKKEVVYICSIYDDYFLGVIRYLEKNWEMLCEEIETGKHQFGQEVESSLLESNPERAKELRKILKNGIQKDTLSLIWPNLQVVSAASKIGTFVNNSGIQQYLSNIAYDASPYGATESMMGIAPEFNDTRIQLLPNVCYYEFIPEKETELENPTTLTMEELVDGQVYEIVITTQAGLYRYRIGDLLRVVGRKYNCPLFRFEGRKGIGIDLASEKSPESVLRNALIVAAVKSRLSLSAYSMYGTGERYDNNGSSTLHYVVQFETKKELSETELSSFAQEIDHQISSIIKSYESARNSGLIQPLQVQQLPKGTFEKYESIARANSINPQQYKRPFIMKIEE